MPEVPCFGHKYSIRLYFRPGYGGLCSTLPLADSAFNDQASIRILRLLQTAGEPLSPFNADCFLPSRLARPHASFLFSFLGRI